MLWSCSLRLHTPAKQLLSRSMLPTHRCTGKVQEVVLCTQEQKGLIDLQPEYQRDFEWELPACSKFIETILLRLPFQEVWLHQISPGHQEVVDGQQRLTTIKAFREGKLPNHQKFKLQVLQFSSWRFDKQMLLVHVFYFNIHCLIGLWEDLSKQFMLTTKDKLAMPSLHKTCTRRTASFAHKTAVTATALGCFAGVRGPG